MAAPQNTSWIIELRSRLSTPPARRLPPTDARRAAVLVSLYVDAGELWTVLTERTEKPPRHKDPGRPSGATAQIAFPGGSLERDEQPWAGTLRGAEEEIGIESRKIMHLGDLDEIETPSGLRITPCVGAVIR